jgi:hypothetical protein
MTEKTKTNLVKAAKIVGFTALAAGAGYGVYRLIEDNFGPQGGVPECDGSTCDAGAGAIAGESLGFSSCDSYGFI